MTIVIDLTPEEEVRLRQEAGQQGQDEETAVKTAVGQWLDQPAPETAEVEIPDYWKGYAGLFDSRTTESPARPEKSSEFTDILVEKYRKQGLRL